MLKWGLGQIFEIHIFNFNGSSGARRFGIFLKKEHIIISGSNYSKQTFYFLPVLVVPEDFGIFLKKKVKT